MTKLLNQLLTLFLVIVGATGLLLGFWSASADTQQKISDSASALIGFMASQVLIISLYPLAKYYGTLEIENKNKFKAIVKLLALVALVVGLGYVFGYGIEKLTSNQFKDLIDFGNILKK